MTDPIAATPGWVEARLDDIFAGLPEQTRAARDALADCLAQAKAPAAPSDLLGAEFEACHAGLRRGLLAAGLDAATLDKVVASVEALEAEIAADS